MGQRRTNPTRFDVVTGTGRVLASRNDVDQALAAATTHRRNHNSDPEDIHVEAIHPTGWRQRLLALP